MLLTLASTGFWAILPVLAVTASLPSTSSNDPFRAIVVLHRTRQPELPLCCLKPPPTVYPSEGPEDVLLSFEEWKSRQIPGSQSTPATPKIDPSHSDTPSNFNVQNTDLPPIDAYLSPADPSHPPSDDSLPPHFRVPIVDRFNYASVDCSARIHTSHKSAKSPSSILTSTKDRYMLTPCNANDQFVVVELCDDIRIDTVQLANFEFFSGVFKDFSVSVAKTYTGTNEGWTPAGTYRAKDVRGVQSFHPPTSLRDFYRYIRIDFNSHYGHEYYCPVSLLRVYGLTHLEEWKWDTWLAESRARLKGSAPRLEHPPAASNATYPNTTSNSGTNVSMTHHQPTAAGPDAVQSSSADATNIPPYESSLPSSRSIHLESQGGDAFDERVSAANVADGEQETLSTPSAKVHSVTEAIALLVSQPSPPNTERAPLHSHDPVIHSTALSSQPSNPSVPVQAPQTPTHAVSSVQWSGESIYRTIMNRLTVLEANHTLYARYVEEQTAGVRDVLRRLGEEVGRLESVTRMQAQMYQRTVHEWERQRLRLEFEHGELLSRVNYLSDEVVLEKRLGIVQLCLLLAVLVFIGLTRGAPPAHHPPPVIHRSRSEWNVHNTSFGSSVNGWSARRRSQSPTERVASAKAKKADGAGHRLFTEPVDLPTPQPGFYKNSTDVPTHTFRSSRQTVAPAAAPSHKRGHTSTTFRTPTKSRSLTLTDLHTLPRTESMTRSHSSTSGHLYIRSAKRWARTAHLHEIKVFHERRGSSSSGVSGKRSVHVGRKDRENDPSLLGDVFDTPLSRSSPFQKPTKCGGQVPRRPLMMASAMVGRGSEENTDVDVWIDMDVDDDVSIVSERAVVLDPLDRDVFGGLVS